MTRLRQEQPPGNKEAQKKDKNLPVEGVPDGGKLSLKKKYLEEVILSPKLQFGLIVLVVCIQFVMVCLWYGMGVTSPVQTNVDTSFRKFETLCKENKVDLSGCFSKLLKVDFEAKVKELTVMANGAQETASKALSVSKKADKTANDLKSEFTAVKAAATEAKTTAKEAKETAGSARSAAETATSTATTAMGTATEAKNTADSVDSKADEAKGTANKALGTAQSAEINAESALTTAEGVRNTAETALSTAKTVLAKAEKAQETAGSALDTAKTAKVTAENAEATAGNALNTAKTAQDTAENAKSTAGNARNTAKTAQDTAENAETTARNALNTANTAQDTAENAKAAAGTALSTANKNTNELVNQSEVSKTRYGEFKKYREGMDTKQEKSHFKMSISEELIDQMRNKELLYDAGVYLSLFSILCSVMLVVLVLRRGNIQQDITTRAVQGSTAPRSTAPETEFRLKWQGPMENSVCVVAFHTETERQHAQETRSVFESAGERAPRIHSRVVRRHADIEGLPGSKVFLIFVDFNERNVILEDPAKGLGNLRVTTVRSLWKFGADVTVIYCKDQGSRSLGMDLFNRDLTSIFSHPELCILKNQERMLSIFDGLSERQNKHCRDVINRQLKRA